MKSAEDIDRIMDKIPAEWRVRWCGGENGPCACMGCVYTGNKLVISEAMTGREYIGDPEYIDAGKLDPVIAETHGVTREEWAAWRDRNSAS